MNTKALYNITYGLYLLSARKDGRDNACIINTAIQVANDPTRLSIAVIQKNHTHDMILETGEFTLSALTVETPFALFQRFGMQSGRDVNKFEGFSDVQRGENGLYYLSKYANSRLSGKVVDKMDLGSHTLFISKLTEAEVLSSAPSCTYGFYQSDIKPKPAKPAKKGWVCSVCGYVYEGDEVPDDFLCPLCSHGKEDFVPASSSAPAAPAVTAPASSGSKKWRCSICGEIVDGDNPPEKCPLCKQPADKFVEVVTGEGMVWACEHEVGIAQGVDSRIIESLRANFEGECSEVGMYLAMARVAHREGYPEIGRYWEKAAHEEAEHAAKFAELLGEVVTDSTKKNLEMRVEAENGATAGKAELAKLAKELNLDALHDTIHEMAKDEARHGKAFEGLLNRYFGE